MRGGPRTQAFLARDLYLTAVVHGTACLGVRLYMGICKVSVCSDQCRVIHVFRLAL